MQEISNDVITEKKASRRYTTVQVRKDHLEAWRKSGVTMSEYCRQHALTLSSLSAWVQSEKALKKSFKPVTLTPSPIGSMKQSSVVEIILDHRIKIRLLDAATPSFIAGIARELIKCN